jgi:hypothetical protein
MCRYTTHLVVKLDGNGRVHAGGGKTLYLALLAGVPVLGLSWLQDSLQAGKLLPEQPYLAKVSGLLGVHVVAECAWGRACVFRWPDVWVSNCFTTCSVHLQVVVCMVGMLHVCTCFKLVPVVQSSASHYTARFADSLPVCGVLSQGVAAPSAVDGGPRRALAAAQQQQRLFASTAFVMVSSSEQHTSRVAVMAHLVRFGGGFTVELEPGSSRRVCGDAAVEQAQRDLQESEFRRRGEGWRQLVVVFGMPAGQLLLDVQSYWGVQDVVSGTFVLDCISSFQMLKIDSYRVTA